MNGKERKKNRDREIVVFQMCFTYRSAQVHRKDDLIIGSFSF